MENIWSNTRWWNKQFQSNILYIQIRRLKKILQIFRSHVHRIRINAKWETVFIEYLSSITFPLRAIFRILGGEGWIPLAAVFVQNPLKENAELRFPYPPSPGWIEKRSERNGESSLGNTELHNERNIQRWPLLGGNRNSLAGSRKPAVIRIHAFSFLLPPLPSPQTASALEIGNHIAGYTDYYAIRV